MVDKLYDGSPDLWRLNYGVITLILKIKDAKVIRAFGPICLLNVCFKILTKILSNRLSLVATKIIGGESDCLCSWQADSGWDSYFT